MLINRIKSKSHLKISIDRISVLALEYNYHNKRGI
jgi:hypothetical protein